MKKYLVLLMLMAVAAYPQNMKVRGGIGLQLGNKIIVQMVLPSAGSSYLGTEYNPWQYGYISAASISNLTATTLATTTANIDTSTIDYATTIKSVIPGNFLVTGILPLTAGAFVGTSASPIPYGAFEKLDVRSLSNATKLLTLKDFDIIDRWFYGDETDNVSMIQTGNNSTLVYYNDKPDTGDVPDHENQWDAIKLAHTYFSDTYPKNKILSFEYQNYYDSEAETDHELQSMIRFEIYQDTTCSYVAKYSTTDNAWTAVTIKRSTMGTTYFSDAKKTMSIAFTLMAKRQRSIKLRNILLYR